MIYLDSAATVPPTEQAVSDFVFIANGSYGNPSSLHIEGEIAKTCLDDARKIVANCIHCDVDEIFFTSGGSEGNNMLIRGWMDAAKGFKNVFVTSNIEHPSILEPVYHNMNNNERFKVYYSPVFNDGLLDVQSFEDTLKIEKSEGGDDLNLLASIQFVNNEIGVKQYVKVLSRLTHMYGGFFHTDAVQAFPHFSIDVKYLGIDAMTVSGHKFGALRGTGFIYISKELQEHMVPMIRGGMQENGMRAGTENVAGSWSLAHRVDHLYNEFDGKEEEYKWVDFAWMLDDSGIDYILNAVPDVNICSIRLPGVNNSQLVTLLSEDGICVSAGSACHNFSPEPSHVLKAIGLSDEEAQNTIRVCVDGVSKEDVKWFIGRLAFYVDLLKE